MNERTVTQATLAPAPRWNRRRLIVGIVAGMVILGAAGLVGLKYFIFCANCGGPILCTDPCTLPTFG